MMTTLRRIDFLGICTLALLTALGCGGPTPTKPGTPGILRSGTQTLPHVRVTLYVRERTRAELVGFGVTDADGKFALFEQDADGPLWLEPGDYVITLEPDGAEPFFWPSTFAEPVKTPLRHSWSGGKQLELDVPAPEHGSPASQKLP